MSASISADWLEDRNLQQLFDIVEAARGEMRVVGGAVRNHLLGFPVADLDLATTLVPEAIIEALEGAHVKVVPTGIDHGTVTAVLDGRGYEITTLRRDVETDGRRAVVSFTTDFAEDAARRDFTINALYVDRNGQVEDHVGGLKDIESGTLRFIGDAEDRIREDYLRILRFFRFFAWFGNGRPDAAGLKACVRLKEGLSQLSAERIWTEMRKMLSAPDPGRALLWMRQTGILTALLPESEKWGIDAIPALIRTEQARDWAPDALLRLMAIIPPRHETVNEIAVRWKLSNAERDRLRAWAALPLALADNLPDAQRLAWRHSKPAVIDALRLKAALADDSSKADLADQLAAWTLPVLPVSGADLVALGFEQGPDLGRALKAIESQWLDSGFQADRDTLLKSVTPSG